MEENNLDNKENGIIYTENSSNNLLKEINNKLDLLLKIQQEKNN